MIQCVCVRTTPSPFCVCTYLLWPYINSSNRLYKYMRWLLIILCLNCLEFRHQHTVGILYLVTNDHENRLIGIHIDELFKSFKYFYLMCKLLTAIVMYVLLHTQMKLFPNYIQIIFFLSLIFCLGFSFSFIGGSIRNILNPISHTNVNVGPQWNRGPHTSLSKYLDKLGTNNGVSNNTVRKKKLGRATNIVADKIFAKL